MKQFEQLLPASQEAIQFLKKYIETYVPKDLSNILYKKASNDKIITYSIYNESIDNSFVKIVPLWR